MCTRYRGRQAAPGYHCPGKDILQGQGLYCLTIGGVQIDQAVSEALLAALQPAGFEAALRAAERLEADHDSALEQWRLAVERARYEAERAERRYRAVEPENRLVARGLETEWEQRLSELEKAQSELERRERRRPRGLTADERKAMLALGTDLRRVWDAPTTTARDKKELLRTLLKEVIVTAPRGGQTAHLTLRWRGGTLTELDIERPQRRRAPIRTDEDTLELVRRLAHHYPDGVIAGILSRQGKTTAYGHPFTAMHVGALRRNWKLGCFDPATRSTDGDLVGVREAAKRLNMTPSTLHRWINDGFIAGEQITPGAPWQVRITQSFSPASSHRRRRGTCRCRTRLESSDHPRASRPLRRTDAGGVRADAGRDSNPRRLAPDRVAACQAWRARRCACPSWEEKRPANQGDRR